MYLRCLPAAGLAALALTVAPAAHAARSYDNCTGFIDSVPATISTQGTWCLRKDLATSLTQANAITVDTNNVTIDCNDFKLGGLGGGGGTSSRGIHALDRQNVTVRNCNIRGFKTGLRLEGNGHLVEDNRFTGNTYSGVEVIGDGSIVRRNLVSDTGGSWVVGWRAVGIAAGNGVDVLDNTVDGVSPYGDASGNGAAVGIYTFQNLGGTVGNNRVRNVVGKGASVDQAIWNQQNQRMWVTGNQLTGSGRANSVAIECESSAAVAAGNLSAGFSAHASGCTDGGGNFHP